MKDRDTDKPVVKNKPIKTKVKIAKNFAKTICVSDTGRVKRTSIVLFLFSSEKTLMARAGINIIKSHGRTLKKGFIEAEPTIKISLINKKFEKTAKRTITTYPTGLFK